MSLQVDELLSPDAPRRPTEFDDSLRPWCEMACDTNRLLVSVVTTPRRPVEGLLDITAVGLMGRLSHELQATVVLADRGFRAQSRTMARSTIETAFYCAAACSNLVLKEGVARMGREIPFLEAFVGGHQQHRRKSAGELAKMEDLGSMAYQLKALHSELSKNRLPEIDVRGLASDLKLSELYTIFYRSLSLDAHPTATSIEHHLELDEERELAGFKIGPDYSQYSGTITAAVAGALLGMEAFLVRFPDAVQQERRIRLLEDYRRLADLACA